MPERIVSEKGKNASVACPPFWKRALIQTGIRTMGVKGALARSLCRGNSAYGLQVASERIVLSDTDSTYQDFRNVLCDLFRGKFRGVHALPALEILQQGYEDHSAQKELAKRQQNEIPTNAWGVYVSMAGIRYAVADVLQNTDHLPTLKAVAADLQYEWNVPTTQKLLEAMGEHARTHFLDELIPALLSPKFDIRSLACSALAKTTDARAQCAMVDALQDTCVLRMERVSASLWDAATEVIRAMCIAVMRTDLLPEARERLREGYMDPSSVHFCDQVRKMGCIEDPENVVDQIMRKDPDRDRKMMRAMAEAMAADEVRKIAKQNGLAMIDWEGPYGQYYAQLAHKLEQDMADAGESVMP